MSTERNLRCAAAPWLLAALVLAGCATPGAVDPQQGERAPLYAERAERLDALGSWSLEGRLAINDGEDGGSGRLQWLQDTDRARMDFHGALGRGAWRLTADANGAELQFADGESYRARTVDALVREQVGWPVPVEPLAWWVRGLAAPGPVEKRRLEVDGTLGYLSQGGWEIEFSRYIDVGGVPMPARRKRHWWVIP